MKGQRDAWVLQVLNKVEAGKMRKGEAAKKLGISVQYLAKLRKRYAEEGAGFLRHGNAGRPSKAKTSEEVSEKVIGLYKEDYQGFNYRHFREKLAEKEGVKISYHALHGILTGAGLASPRKHRERSKKKSHPSRPRRESFGELLQIDASWHPWFGDDAPKATLHGAIDDATGTVMGLWFDAYETLSGYREMLRRILDEYGIPEALYSDNRTIFEFRKADGSDKASTHIQFRQWCGDLGIEVITTSVPQAKGRIERLWGTLQSRLVSELRVRGIKTIEGANAFLQEFTKDFNSRFAANPDMGRSLFAPAPGEEEAKLIMSVRHERSVDSGSCFSHKGKRLQAIRDDGTVLPVPKGSRVTVLELWDGGVKVRCGKGVYGVREADPRPAEEPRQKPESKASAARKPKPDHPWRNSALFAKKKSG